MTFAGCGHNRHFHYPTSKLPLPWANTNAFAARPSPLLYHHLQQCTPAKQRTHAHNQTKSLAMAQQQKNGWLAVLLLASLFLAAFTNTAEGERASCLICCLAWMKYELMAGSGQIDWRAPALMTGRQLTGLHSASCYSYSRSTIAACCACVLSRFATILALSWRSRYLCHLSCTESKTWWCLTVISLSTQ